MVENGTIKNRPELDDPDLIRRAQMEDISAYEQLVCRYYGQIYGLVYGLVGNRDDAEDVARSVFVKAWRAIRHFREKADFSFWICRIAMYQTARFHRRHPRRKAVRFEEFSLEAKQADSYKKFSQKGAVLRKMSLRDFQKKMEEALSVIPYKDRFVLVLHDVQGLTPVEIVKITGGSENTATSRLLYARKKLASKFSSLDETLVGVSEQDVPELLSLKRFELPSPAQVEKNIENVMRAVREAQKRPSLHHFPDKSMGWMFAQPRYGVAALFILFLALHILDRPLPDAPVGVGTLEEPTPGMEVMDGTETNFVPTVGSPIGIPVYPSFMKQEGFIETNP